MPRARGMAARKERERRRRKAMLEQQATQRAMEEKRREQLLAEKLLKQSAQERKLGARLAQTRMHKEVIKENRLIRERQYAAQRQRDFEDVLRRDAELGRLKRAEAEHAMALEKERREELQAQKAVAKAEANLALCDTVLKEVVDLSLHVAEQRMLSDAPMQPKEWRECKLMFVQGQPLLPAGEGWGESVQDDESSLDAGALLLDEQALQDYLLRKGDWSEAGEVEGDFQPSLDPPPPSKAEAEAEASTAEQDGEEAAPTPSPPDVESNLILGELLADIETTLNPPPEPETPEKLPQSHLKVVLCGKPFSGKSVQASKLGDAYGLVVINPVAVLQNAMEQPLCEVTEDDARGVPPLEQEFNRLKGAAEALLESGSEVDDATMADLIALEIHKVSFDQEFVPTSVSDGAAEEETPAGEWTLKLKAEDDIGGWVLENFPATASQAELLEKALSGIDGQAVAGPEPETGVKSIIAPAPPAPPQPPLISAVDAVLRFDVSDDVVVERAAGRRVDPETGAIYHLLHNPPPEDEALKERLQPIDEASNDEPQLLHRCATYASQEPQLEEWFAPFLTLRPVDASASEAQTEEQVRSLLQEVVDAKAAATAAAAEEADSGEAAVEAGDDDAAAEPEQVMLDKLSQVESDPEIETEAEPEDEDGAAAEPVAEIDAEVPQSEASPVVPRPLTQELASILQSQWIRVEDEYQKRLRRAFRAVRAERGATVERVALVKKEFLEFVRRSDNKTSVVESWQLKFNQLPPEMRADAETKQELHLRAVELRDELWQICDDRKAEAETTREAVANDLWVRDHVRLLEEVFIAALQAEVDRCVHW
eukprot:COSAG01_NODE_5046_length_4528_cov_2.039287_2_plen_827_part_00